MKIEFNIYEAINKDKDLFRIVKSNEFIVVGEEVIGNEVHFLIHELSCGGIKLVSGINIQDSAYRYPKKDMELAGGGIYTDCIDLDIPGEYLTIQIMEEIQKFNN